MKPAVDTAKLGVTLSQEEGREPAGIIVTNAEDADLSQVLAKLSGLSDAIDVSARVDVAAELLEPLLTDPESRAALGRRQYRWVSSWQHRNSIHDLINHLTIAVALKNSGSDDCAFMSLRRTLPLFRDEKPGAYKKQLTLLLEVALHHYATTDVEARLNDLREVFRAAVGIPFVPLARTASQLLKGNHHTATQRLPPREMIDTLFARNRTEHAAADELTKGVQVLIAEHSIEFWQSALASLYFDPGEASSDFAICCTRFLRLCFAADDPALLLANFTNLDGSYLVRIVDLDAPHLAHDEHHRFLSRNELFQLIKEKGVPPPDIPEEVALMYENNYEDFFDRNAQARVNGKTWLKNKLYTVVTFPGSRR
jgi:hypothetical protein